MDYRRVWPAEITDQPSGGGVDLLVNWLKKNEYQRFFLSPTDLAVGNGQFSCSVRAPRRFHLVCKVCMCSVYKHKNGKNILDTKIHPPCFARYFFVNQLEMIFFYKQLEKECEAKYKKCQGASIS